jgi:hypothetical protein
MRNLKWIGLPAVTLIAVLLLWPADLRSVAQEKEPLAGNNCSVQSAGGTYSFAIFGTTLPDNPYGLPPGPYNAAGTITLDGKGNYTLKDSSMKNGGPVLEEVITGTYTVDGCRLDFNMFGTIPVAVMYSTDSLQHTQGVSLLEGTNWTYLGTRK